GEDLVRDANVAMYRAKRAGRGRCELFDDAMRAETVERIALTNDLRRAIEDGDLRLVYQPLVHLGRRQASGFEALVRWTHPERGVRIALDDFGVGQSSLACLRDLPLDALKLDRQFITSLASSREAAAIVRAVCDMARTLRFDVVAEGVETEAQSQVVEALGC